MGWARADNFFYRLGPNPESMVQRKSPKQSWPTQPTNKVFKMTHMTVIIISSIFLMMQPNNNKDDMMCKYIQSDVVI